MPDRIVYFNGRFVAEREARVSIYDSALVMGDMAYEVTRTVRQRPFRLRAHLERLWHSLDAMRIDARMTIEALERVTLEVVERNLPTESADDDWNIIHNVSRGPAWAFHRAFTVDELQPTVIVSCYPVADKMAELAPAYTSGLDAFIPPQRSIPTTLVDASIKTRSRWHYQNANLQASLREPGAVAVLIDPDGYLTEGTSGNVFIVAGGVLITPEPRNLLAGVTRGIVLELAAKLGIEARESNVTPAETLSADEMFITSTSIGIVHIRSLDGHAIGDGQLGPITRRLRAALHEELGLDLAAQAEFYARRRSSSAGQSASLT